MESMTFKEKEQEDKRRTFVEKKMKSNVLFSAA